MNNPIARLFRSRDKPSPTDAVSAAPVFYMGMSASGAMVNERSAMRTSTVYACVRIIAESVASLPLHTYRATGEGRERATDHPLYRLLHNEPNVEMTSFSFREALMTHLLLWGNAYAQIIRNGRGQIIGLYPLLPDKMRVDRDDRNRLYYEYNKDGTLYWLGPEEVLHIPGLGFDGIIGYSPIAMARNAVGMSITAEEYGSKFFANNATPSGVLTHPGQIKDPTEFKERWKKTYGGSNRGGVAILEEGMKFEPMSMSNDDAQFLETRKFQVEEICRIFQVPPHLVASLDRATFSNIESQSISFVTHTIRPWLVRWEQAMDRALFSKEEKGGFFVSFVVDGLLRGNYVDRMNGYAIGIQNGFMSPNDVRALENLNPIPDAQGGNEYHQNGNMQPLKAPGGNGGESK